MGTRIQCKANVVKCWWWVDMLKGITILAMFR